MRKFTSTSHRQNLLSTCSGSSFMTPARHYAGLPPAPPAFLSLRLSEDRS